MDRHRNRPQLLRLNWLGWHGCHQQLSFRSPARICCQPSSRVWFPEPARAEIQRSVLWKGLRCGSEQTCGRCSARAGLMSLLGAQSGAERRPSTRSSPSSFTTFRVRGRPPAGILGADEPFVIGILGIVPSGRRLMRLCRRERIDCTAAGTPSPPSREIAIAASLTSTAPKARSFIDLAAWINRSYSPCPTWMAFAARGHDPVSRRPQSNSVARINVESARASRA